MILAPAKVTFTVADAINQDGSVDITVTSTAVALYVTLTSQAPGRFSDNAFLLAESTAPGATAANRGSIQTVVHFIPFGDLEVDLHQLKKTTRIEHAAAYM